MSRSVEAITLERLKEKIGEKTTAETESFFRELLSAETDFLEDDQNNPREVSLLNHLFQEYNKWYCDDAQRPKVKQYHPCLFEVFNWFLPFMDTFHKVILYTNMCILSDDLSDSEFHEEHFETCLNDATIFVNQCVKKVFLDEKALSINDRRLLCEALYSLGFLNLREHNYKSASDCLQPCAFILSSSLKSRDEIDLYFKCIVHLANSFEYDEKPDYALNCLLYFSLPGDWIKDENDEEHKNRVKTASDNWLQTIERNSKTIIDIILKYYSEIKDSSIDSPLSAKDQSLPTVKQICNLLFVNSPTVINQLFSLDVKEGELHETIKLYLHVLAHCISEFAAKMRTDSFSFSKCSTLQLVSKFLLDWLVTSCGASTLVSCQATIRAENDACPEAISLLLRRYDSLKNQNPLSSEQEKELKELSFFLFYFSEQELRFNYDDEKLRDIFTKFGDSFRQSSEQIKNEADPKRRDSNDPLFHYYVIQFKYLFKRAAEQLLVNSANPSEKDQTAQGEIDFVYAQMCKYEGLCSKHIFRGLIDECNRLKRLYTVFQKLRCLDCDTCQSSDYIELSQVLSYIDENYAPYIEGSHIQYEDILELVYREIMKRNKILILAPVEDAPSCSSEYQEIRKMLEFNTTPIVANSMNNPLFDSYAAISHAQDRDTIQLKTLNNITDYSTLKWAVFISNSGNTKPTYLYLKRDDIERLGYRTVIPITLNPQETTELQTRIINSLEGHLSNSGTLARRGSNSKCPRPSHNRDYGRVCCTHVIDVTEEGSDILNSVNNLLVFLEFDFHAASTYPICKDDRILICNPSTHTHNFLAILTFERELPQVPKGKGLCSLCEDFCTYVEQHDIPPKALQPAEKPTSQTAEETKGFCWSFPYNADEEIIHCLERLNETVQDDPEQRLPNTNYAGEFQTKIERSCYKGICECKGGGCYVREAKSQFNMG